MAKKFTRAGSLAIGFAATVGIFCGCTDTNSAGVWTETESGQTASTDPVTGEKIITSESCSEGIPSNLKKVASKKGEAVTNCDIIKRAYALTNIQGKVLDASGNAMSSARVLLKRAEGNYNVDGGTTREVVQRETFTDENGNYTFKDLIYKATFENAPFNENYERDENGKPVVYFDYTLQVENDDQTMASFSSIDLKNAEKITKDEEPYRKIETAKLGKTYSREISLKGMNYSASEKVCLDYSFACHTLTEDDVTKGSFLMENIPEGVYQNLCRYAVNAAGTTSEYTTSLCKVMEEPVITKEAVGELSFVLPEEALVYLDSLTDKSIKNILVPVSLDDVASPVLVNTAGVCRLVSADDSEAGNYWAEISFVSDTATYDVIDEANQNISNNVVFSAKSVQEATVESIDMKRTNTGFSFKINLDGSKEKQPVVLLSNVKEDYNGKQVGYEIRQCEEKSKSLCTRIYSGLDSVATDTIVYGKSDLLDGEDHIFTIVFVENHLSIAVDGKVIRDTDLKVSNTFHSFEYADAETTLGKAELTDFVMFKMSTDIRKKGETNWNRLKAWLITHQLMSLR